MRKNTFALPPAVMVDEILGKSYYVVKDVYDRLDTLKTLATSDVIVAQETLFKVANQIEELGTVIDELRVLAAHTAEIDKVGSVTAELADVAGNLDEIRLIAQKDELLQNIIDSLDSLTTLEPHLEEVGIVASNINSVIQAGSIADQVAGLMAQLVEIQQVASNVDEIKTVGNALLGIPNVAIDFGSIAETPESINNTDSSAIGIVARNDDGIRMCAEHMDAIIKVANSL